MKIGTVRHPGLEEFITTQSVRGIGAINAKKINRAMAAILGSDTTADIAAFPGWRFHELQGARRGTYSMRITGNLRLTFTVDGETANALELEDYH